MSWVPIVARKFETSDALRSYVMSVDFSRWRPSLIVWHNTAAPTLSQWKKSAEADRAAGRVPGITRINNLQTYYRDQRGWSSGPHAFVADDGVWIFTSLNVKGTHSPSWNGMSIGIEMIGDFDVEDDETGAGLLVRKNTVALTAILCEKLGLDPAVCVRLHKEDPRTTHDCPGKNISRDKNDMIGEVREFMGHAGEHVDERSNDARRAGKVDVPPHDWLNMRNKASMAGAVVAKLPPETPVLIFNDDNNGGTKWLHVSSLGFKGWVAARYVKET